MPYVGRGARCGRCLAGNIFQLSDITEARHGPNIVESHGSREAKLSPINAPDHRAEGAKVESPRAGGRGATHAGNPEAIPRWGLKTKNASGLSADSVKGRIPQRDTDEFGNRRGEPGDTFKKSVCTLDGANHMAVAQNPGDVIDAGAVTPEPVLIHIVLEDTQERIYRQDKDRGAHGAALKSHNKVLVEILASVAVDRKKRKNELLCKRICHRRVVAPPSLAIGRIIVHIRVIICRSISK